VRYALLALVLLGAVGGAYYYSQQARRVRFPSQEALVLGLSPGQSGKQTVELLSKTYSMDRLYTSMDGPSGVQGIRLLPDRSGELLWLVGVTTQVVQPEDDVPESAEFFCHANLTLEPASRIAGLSDSTDLDGRYFTLVPGRLGITLPDGFGMPVMSGQSLNFLSMSLNRNVAGRPVSVRFKTRVDFIRDADTRTPMKPVFRRTLYVVEPLAGKGASGVGHAHGGHPDGCVEPSTGGASDGAGVTASPEGIVPRLGDSATMHWMVPPGRREYRTRVDEQMNLPFDTTIHYASAHLHPYATFLELFDQTEGKSVLRLNARGFPDKLGVAHIDDLSSSEGVPVYRSHEYELIAAYDNTSSAPVDAMGILYLYGLQKNFQQPAAAGRQARSDG